MSNSALPAGAFDGLIRKLDELTEDFFEQVGRAPFLKELLEIFEWASYGLYSARPRFEATLEGRREYKRRDGSLVDELNDSIIVDATRFLAELLELSNGRSLSDLAASVSVVLKASGLLLDVPAAEVTRVTASLPKAVAKPRIGDILAIPAESGGYHVTVVVARNRFGTALGLLQGRISTPRPLKGEDWVANSLFFYTDDRLVLTGDWKVIGYDRNLLSRFPEDPDIYHGPDLQWPGIETGEFGAAENPAGDMRLIGREEAHEVGILGGSYRQSYMGESVQRLLDEVAR